MRRLIFGVVLPLSLWVLVIFMRASWPYDIHPWQPLWVLWVLSMSAGAFLGGVGFRDYWLKNRDQPGEHDTVQLAADESVPDRTHVDDHGRTWEWCGGQPGTWGWRVTALAPRDGDDPPQTPG